jgi:Tetracyclin repressor-like, C-terminal domain
MATMSAIARAAAFFTQMSGVVHSRYLLGVVPIASMGIDDHRGATAPSLQLALAPTTRPDVDRPAQGFGGSVR